MRLGYLARATYIFHYFINLLRHSFSFLFSSLSSDSSHYYVHLLHTETFSSFPSGSATVQCRRHSTTGYSVTCCTSYNTSTTRETYERMSVIYMHGFNIEGHLIYQRCHGENPTSPDNLLIRCQTTNSKAYGSIIRRSSFIRGSPAGDLHSQILLGHITAIQMLH